MNPKKFLRLKLSGAKVLEIDPTLITCMRIVDIEDAEKGQDYMLSIANNVSEFIVCVGRFDECHMLLNKLHSILDIELIDI